jgi:hypothetical protein
VTRFAWLQARNQNLLAAAILAALAALAAVTGVHLAHLYDSLVAHCPRNQDCQLASEQFTAHYTFLQNSFTLIPRLVPALLGIFWGAPLFARELETGTFRLAWTQSVSRSRWLLTKLAIGALATVLAAGVLTVIITWWSTDLERVDASRYGLFDARDLAPVGYALCAFALGALAGVVIRRTVPAMAASLAVFIFVRIAVQQWVRPHLMPTKTLISSLLGGKEFGFFSNNGGPVDLVARADGPRNSWVLSTHILDASGHATTAAERAAFVHKYCAAIATPPPPGGPNSRAVRIADPSTIESCRSHAAQAFHLLVTYQPAGHYWPLQFLETGVFAVVALLAMAGCYWWITRRAV